MPRHAMASADLPTIRRRLYMRAPVLLSKATGFLTALKIWSIDPAYPSGKVASPAPASPLARKRLLQSMEGYLFKHLSAYAELQTLLALGTPLDRLSESREVVQDATNLAAKIASIPGYKEIEPLYEAHKALVEHWRSRWSNGGVSTIAYRTRLKGLILFIRSQCQSQEEAVSLCRPCG